LRRTLQGSVILLSQYGHKSIQLKFDSSENFITETKIMGVRNNRKTHFGVYETREMSKHALAAYAMDKWNNLDSSLDKMIEKLEAENKESVNRYEEMNNLFKV
jgi:hypothetical protein